MFSISTPKGQRKEVAKQIFKKSKAFLKGCSSAVSDRFDKNYHRQIVQEYLKLYATITSKGKELKRSYLEKKRELYNEARNLPDHPDEIPEYVQYKIKLLRENGFDQEGATTLSKISKSRIKSLLKMKQNYETEMKIVRKSMPDELIKPKSDKELAYQNNMAILKKYEALSPKSAYKNKSLIVACLKQIHLYEQDMNLEFTKTKFDILFNIKPPVKQMTKKKPMENTETQNHDAKATPDKSDENDVEIIEIAEEQKDHIDLTADSTDAESVVDLEKDQQNDDNQEGENDKELLQKED